MQTSHLPDTPFQLCRYLKVSGKNSSHKSNLIAHATELYNVPPPSAENIFLAVPGTCNKNKMVRLIM